MMRRITTLTGLILTISALIVLAPGATEAQLPRDTTKTPYSYGSWQTVVDLYLNEKNESGFPPVNAPFYVTTLCERDPEWARNIFHALVAAETQDHIGEWALYWANDLERCQYEPMHDWFRDALPRARNPSAASQLIEGIFRSWRPGDMEVLLEFGSNLDLPESTRYIGLRMAAHRLKRTATGREDLFFELYRRRVMPEELIKWEMAEYYLTRPSEAVARRAVQALREDPEHPRAARMLKILHGPIGQPTGQPNALSRELARELLEVLEPLKLRPDLQGYAQRVEDRIRRRLGGDGGGSETAR